MGKLIHVTDVVSGLECNCVCPNCHEKLVAVNKSHNKQLPHFRHYDADPCRGGIESVLHKMAKQLIGHHKKVRAPALIENIPQKKDELGRFHGVEPVEIHERLYEFIDVIEENTSFGRFIPDVTGIGKNDNLHVEILVTHKVEPEKQQQVRRHAEYMIEIDISKAPPEILMDKDKFQHLVIDDTKNKVWISHPKARQLYRKRMGLLDQEIADANKAIREKQANMERKARQKEALQEQQLKQLKESVEEYRKKISPLMEVFYATREEAWQQERYTQLEAFALNGEIEPFVNSPIANDWLINTHRSVWQRWVFDQFIQNAPIGSIINISDITKGIRKKYGGIKALLDLDYQRYKLNQITKNEMELLPEHYFGGNLNSVPSLYRVVGDYCRVLCLMEIIHRYESAQFVVSKNDFNAIVLNVNKLLKLPPDRVNKYEFIGIDKYKERYKEARYEILKPRLEQILRSERRVFYDYQAIARRCFRCYLVSHEGDGELCPFCNSDQLSELYRINKEDIGAGEKRYRSSVTVSMSFDSVKTLNNLSMLEEWAID